MMTGDAASVTRPRIRKVRMAFPGPGSVGLIVLSLTGLSLYGIFR